MQTCITKLSYLPSRDLPTASLPYCSLPFSPQRRIGRPDPPSRYTKWKPRRDRGKKARRRTRISATCPASRADYLLPFCVPSLHVHPLKLVRTVSRTGVSHQVDLRPPSPPPSMRTQTLALGRPGKPSRYLGSSLGKREAESALRARPLAGNMPGLSANAVLQTQCLQ